MESKSAEDAELFDYQLNIRYENCFTITGEYPIIVVLNATSKRKDTPATYHVQLSKVEDSAEIRKKFGTHFLGGRDTRPPAVKAFSITNRVTPATSVRVPILKTLGQRYVASNPGPRFQNILYEPRPLLKLTTPDAADRRVQSYNFIEAIRTLPVNFTQDELSQIIRTVSPKLYGKLRSLFNVISDDMVKRFTGAGKSSKSSGQGGSGSGSGSGVSNRGGSSGQGRLGWVRLG